MISHMILLSLIVCIACPCVGQVAPSPHTPDAIDHQQSEEAGRLSEKIQVPNESIWVYAAALEQADGRFKAFSPHGISERGFANKEKQLVRDVRNKLRLRKVGDKAGSAFVVNGKGMEALQNVYETLTKERPTNNDLVAGSDASIFFFAYETSPPIRLLRVFRSDGCIEIQYQFVLGHSEGVLRPYFSLVPIDSCLEGEIEVEIAQQSPLVATGVIPEEVPNQWVKKVLCKSFSFQLVKDSSIQGE